MAQQRMFIGNVWGHGGGGGPFYLQIEADGHLYAYYNDAYGEPPLEVGEDGHLYWTFTLED